MNDQTPTDDLDASGYVPLPAPDPDQLPGPGRLPPGSRLPFDRNAQFSGRTEPLLDLARRLLHSQVASVLITQAVQGMGGIGKTQLAVEFAYRYGRFFHGVHWLNCAVPEAINAEIATCGAAMQLPSWSQELPEQVRLTLQAWRNGRAHLVVLDDLESIEAAREWLPQLAGGVRLLLTARQRDWPLELGLDPLRLSLFSPAESLAFLRKVLPPDRAFDADLGQLAERLGHLPLALRLAGRFLARQGRLTVTEYLAGLGDVLAAPAMRNWRAELSDLRGHDFDLAASFLHSWQHVTDQAAQRVFLMAAYCAANQPIPRELLAEVWKADRSGGLQERIGNIFRKERSRPDLDQALALLAGLGLLDLDDPAASPTIHPLLAELARVLPAHDTREDVGARSPRPLAVLAAALADLSREANEAGAPAHLGPLWPHLEAAAPAAEEAGLEEAGTLWNNLGYHRRTVGDYAGARAALERALAVDEAIFGPDDVTVAADANDLGLVLQSLGDLVGARAAFERVLQILAQTLLPDHPYLAATRNNLGTVLRALGDLAGARAAFEQAVAIDEAAFGPDHPRVATAVNNLGTVLRDLGDLAGARATFGRALAIDEAAFGPDHPNVARDINNLGLVLRDLGDLAGARAAYERALAIDQAAFGPDHPTVAIRVNNLGSVLKALGDYAGARAAYERALAIDEAAFGPDHPEVATALNNLGSVLQDLGDLPGAQAALERVLGILVQTLPPDHPQLAAAHNNLGSVLWALGDLAGARAAFERALTIDEAALGPDHPTVAIRVNNLGSVLQTLGDLAGARADFERALAIDQAAFGPDHPNVARDVNNLGMVLQALGDPAGARAAYERALAILEPSLPAGHPHIHLVQENLASLQ